MHQAAARLWNEVAQGHALRTEWARQMFPLQQEDIDLALRNEEKRLTRLTKNPVLTSAYLKVMPLLWENQAISNYLRSNPDRRPAIPPIESIDEAILIAQKDFRLTSHELRRLAKMLAEPPTPGEAFSLPDKIVGKYDDLLAESAKHKSAPYRIAEAIFRPSFHPEVFIRVSTERGQTSLELTSSASTFSPRFTHSSTIEPRSAHAFWIRLEELLPSSSNSADRAGFDGMLVEVNCRTPAGAACFQVQSPSTTTAAGQLVGLIYDLALEASYAPPAMEALERLYGYLRDDVPALILIAGSIHRLRLFGALTNQHHESLRQLAVSLLSTRTLLIDLTNLEAMGPALYDVVTGLHSLHPHSAFAASPVALRHLENMQIPTRLVFDRVDDASKYLTKSAT